MRKVLVIALREYRAAVRTKAFLISLVMLPVLMGGSILVQLVLRNADDTKEKRFAVIDRTPGHTLFDALQTASEERDELAARPDADGDKKRVRRGYTLERLEPSAADAEAVTRQRLEVSDLVEKGAYQGFLDIGADVYSPHDAPGRSGEDDRASVRFQSNKPQTAAEFFPWAEKIINLAVERQRLVNAGIPLENAQAAQVPVTVRAKGLTHRNPITGAIEDTTEEKQIVALVAPAVLVAMMFVMIMIGASPAMQSVLEEKMQRIAEVLLGSVRPFDLMLGKLIGMVGVSLTVATVYLGGMYVAAHQYGYTDFLSPYVLAWFVVFLVLAVVMYGSLFIAVGAAANDMKETQSLLMPVMIVAVLPMLFLGPIMMDPESRFATVCSFIPTMTPMLMIVRISVPPGVAWWEPLVGIAGVLATTLACVYAGGRIFRIGILMQGKGARLTDLVKWAVRG